MTSLDGQAVMPVECAIYLLDFYIYVIVTIDQCKT